jgi:beta-lactamase class D
MSRHWAALIALSLCVACVDNPYLRKTETTSISEPPVEFSYGKFCGPNHPILRRYQDGDRDYTYTELRHLWPPLDDLDAICYAHDYCFQKAYQGLLLSSRWRTSYWRCNSAFKKALADYNEEFQDKSCFNLAHDMSAGMYMSGASLDPYVAAAAAVFAASSRVVRAARAETDDYPEEGACNLVAGSNPDAMLDAFENHFNPEGAESSDLHLKIPRVVESEVAPTGSENCGEQNPVCSIFESEGIVGTFVAASVDGDPVHIHNNARSNERFSPASTFKIPHTLIALDLGKVDSALSTFTWDGIDRGNKNWNQDQTLQSAFKVSCVWCYQEIARKVGKKYYNYKLQELGYGNEAIGDRLNQFWLDGSLQISAVEQIDFLRRLYNDELPYSREHIDVLKKIMIARQTEDHTMYAKTGWAMTNPQVAWYVGFVESDSGTWLFAMNMRVDRPEQAAIREDITIQSLQALGII